MKSRIVGYVFKVLCGGIIFYCCLTSCDNSVESGEYGYSDDYMIYSKVLSETINDEGILIVLTDSTEQDSFIQNNIEYYLERFPDADRGTLENYITANQSKSKLCRIPGIKFVFQSDYDGSADNKVNVYLSNVGYNSNKTEAFVSMGALYAPLVGSGSLIFLVKINNQWQIQKRVMTWIS